MGLSEQSLLQKSYFQPLAAVQWKLQHSFCSSDTRQHQFWRLYNLIIWSYVSNHSFGLRKVYCYSLKIRVPKQRESECRTRYNSKKAKYNCWHIQDQTNSTITHILYPDYRSYGNKIKSKSTQFSKQLTVYKNYRKFLKCWSEELSKYLWKTFDIPLTLMNPPWKSQTLFKLIILKDFEFYITMLCNYVLTLQYFTLFWCLIFSWTLISSLPI